MIIAPKNWQEFQHYRDRSPSWVKLHRSLLDNYEFHCLPVASRALAPMLWLLASEHQEGHLEADSKKIAFRLRMQEKEVAEALKPLIESGFFVVVRDASETLAEAERVDSLEKEREIEEEEEKDSASDDAGHADKPVYLTKKKRQLTGKQLEAFERFWETFAYPKGKAEAADAWIDLKVTQSLLPQILAGAKREAARRAAVLAKGGSPKWAQGWLSGRRWEDGEEATGAGGDEKPWYQRADGIEAKGDELGIEKGPDESFPAFKARVLQAAGVSA